MLPYQQASSNKISRLLAKCDIKTLCVLVKKTISTLRLLKEQLGLITPGIYCIPCECEKVYVRQTSSIETRCKGHMK